MPASEPPARGFDESFCEIGGNGYFTTERFLNGKQIGVSKDPGFYFTNAVTGYANNRLLELAKGPVVGRMRALEAAADAARYFIIDFLAE